MDYTQAWGYQENLLQENVRIKTEARRLAESLALASDGQQTSPDPAFRGVAPGSDTRHYLLFVEHPPVYTLGKSGHMENILIGEQGMKDKGIQFFQTNRGGEIT